MKSNVSSNINVFFRKILLNLCPFEPQLFNAQVYSELRIKHFFSIFIIRLKCTHFGDITFVRFFYEQIFFLSLLLTCHHGSDGGDFAIF